MFSPYQITSSSADSLSDQVFSMLRDNLQSAQLQEISNVETAEI